MNSRLHLCLLWHMHQPVYRDPETGEFILPWVRLHATRSYYDMARVLGEFENVRVVINLVPSLMEQLLQYVRGNATDRFLELSRREADSLTPVEVTALLRNFFMVGWEQNVYPMPRYLELLERRGRDVSASELESAARTFSARELRDLQVLFNLAWMGFSAEEEEEIVRTLKAKGRDFTEEEKRELLAAQLRIVSRVLPAFKEAAASGRAELTVTPFYHPILPLLIDTQCATRCMPWAELPPRFAYPEDAREQVRRALDFAERELGVRPRGMWPAEGSVSPEAVELFASEGLRWCASDEGVLFGSTPKRERGGGHLFRPYRVKAGERHVDMLFRDRGLSDLVGFTYARMRAADAVDDLFKHLDRIATSAKQGEVPLVPVVLDGENAWEHYPSSGRDFLRELYGRLERREGGIESVKAGDYLEVHPPGADGQIERLHTGSWIDANFRIWIGHPEDNDAWTQLGEARRALAEAEAAKMHDAGALARAKEALLVAEGSDWFWWYGDDFTTDSAAEFDALFRGYLRAAWRALGKPPPVKLERPISRRARAPSARQQNAAPRALITPRVMEDSPSYIDWLGAARYSPREGQGSMARGEGLILSLGYGFDLERLYLRLDPSGDVIELLTRADVLELRLAVGERELRLFVPLARGALAPRLGERALGQGSLSSVLQLALPFEGLGAKSGEELRFCAELRKEGALVERLPPQGELSIAIPSIDFEARNWRI